MDHSHQQFRPDFHQRRSPGFPVVLLALIVLVACGGLWLLRGGGFGSIHDETAASRAITPRGDLSAAEKTTIELFRQGAPAVVHITNLARRRSFFSMNVTQIPQGTGSGFIWDERGYIVTNYHVLQGGSSWHVRLADGDTYEATVVGGDPNYDLAVLRIKTGSKTLRPVLIGTSSDLQVGQTVLAIGNPFGLDQTLTTGVISGLDREIKSVTGRPIQGVIQTDAAINPGNSGGPLLDSAGRLIGVNTAIFSRSGESAGIGFAVPVDTVNKIVPSLIRRGSRAASAEAPQGLSACMGVYLFSASMTRRLGLPGVMIDKVLPGGAAEKAGLRGLRETARGRVIFGDIILKMDEQEVSNSNDVRAFLIEKSVGDTVKLVIRRDGQPREVSVTLQPIQQ